MRRVAVLALTLALATASGALAACSASGDGTPEPTATLTSGLPAAAGRALTAEEAEAALLTADDVGPDWSVTAEAVDPFGAAGPVASDPTCQPFVDAFVGAENTWGLGAPSTEAQTVIRRDGGGPFDLEQVLARVGSYPETIDTAGLDDLVAAIEPCRRFEVSAQGLTSTVVLSPISGVDAEIAVRLEVTVAFLGGVAEISSVAIGRNLVTVAVLGLGDVDATLLPRLLDVAVERLVAVTTTAG